MNSKEKKDWFKLKRYPHIGMPLNPNDRHLWIEKYVTDNNEIAKHAFLPFIHKTAEVKKFRKTYSAKDGKVVRYAQAKNKILRTSTTKKRELYYASHIDSLIFSYYASILSDYYEDIISRPQYNLTDVVNAYRTIPVNPKSSTSSNKCNIDFANDIFQYIKDFPENEFAVIAFDISSFFDDLDHTLLRKMWAEIMGCEKLPLDHFNVFKNITRFSCVDLVDIFEEFQDRIYTRKKSRSGHFSEIKQKRVDSIKYLRNQNAIAFCTKPEFLKVKGKLLQPAKTKKLSNGKIVNRTFGVPQGSAISSVLANIYLLHFDKIINKFATVNKGIYRRYSDDILVVCPLGVKNTMREIVYREIANVKLEIQQSKTQVFHFRRVDDSLCCGQEFENCINWDKNLLYLGLEFNGQNVRLKSASLAGYYRKMKRHIHRAKHYSERQYAPNRAVLFKRRIFRKFSYKGAKRMRKYLWNDAEGRFLKSHSYNWGNFLSYAYKASNVIENNIINKQVKRHWNILNRLIR